MKQLTSFLLALLLTVGVLATPTLAAGEDYTFTLTANGKNDAAVMVGDTVTVTLQVTNNRAGSIELYGVQDYINFNPDYLEFIPGTERFFEVEGYPVINGSILPGGRQVFTNRAGLEPILMDNGSVLMQFQLRAKKAGSAELTSSVAQMLSQTADKFSVRLEDARVVISEAHTHTLQQVPEKPATEQADGMKAHWVCTGCGQLFLDAAGKQPAGETELLIPKLQHVHELVFVPGKEPTETVLGLREHWVCKGCGKLFLDEKATQEVSQADLLIEKTPHVHELQFVAEKHATEQETGVLAHWVCIVCGRLFSDAQGVQEVSADALVIPKVVPGQPETQPDPVTPAGFADVPAGAWFAPAVDWAVQKGVTTGVSAASFGPDLACTRSQAVTFLWRAAGSPVPLNNSCPFTDVPADAWYRTAVLWALEKGVTTGTSKTTFGPELPCTRGQIVTFLWRAKGAEAVTGTLPFGDVAADSWYAKPVLWAVNKGVTTGVSASSFAPELSCTRGQIVTFLYRAE